jgi:arylsulfatase A-like enzyme
MTIEMLTRREFLTTTAVAGFATLASSRGHPLAQARRPNLLFILADDLGYGDLSAFGRPDYRTPHIDRLVAEGVRFTNAYAAASTCTPTRVAFMTGRYPQRLAPELQRPMGWGTRESGPPKYGLSPSHPTLPSLLKRAGYRTALVGKWHLGFMPEFRPNRHGFDEFFGIHGGGADYFTHSGPAGQPDLWENEVPAERVGYLTDVLSDRATEFIVRRHDRPFYLSLHYTAPHWPWEGPRDGHGKDPKHHFVDGGSRPVFVEMMRSLDEGVGRVLRALRRSGIERDTLVVFTSDNGGERFSYNWPWTDGKFTLWEGGIRVPLAMRWPARLPRAGASDQLAISMDWAATLLAAAGASPDPAFPLDGIDLVPFALGERATQRSLFWRQPYPEKSHAAARHDHWKYLRIGDDEYLFDLAVDSGEKANLTSQRVDVFERMRADWAAWNAQMVPIPKPAASR